jgi:hypothetical protein
LSIAWDCIASGLQRALRALSEESGDDTPAYIPVMDGWMDEFID